MEFTELVNTQHHYHFVQTWKNSRYIFTWTSLPKVQVERNRSPTINVDTHIKTDQSTRFSNVRGESRYAIAITNILVNLANYLQFRPPDKLVRWRDSEDCTAIL